MRNKQIALIKGIACMIVFGGHFWDCFYWYSDIDKSSSSIVREITEFPFYFFICGGFMVYIFCILSGYLLYHKEIEKISSLVIAIIKRYVRFLIPVLISNIIIFCGGVFKIFPVEKAAVVLRNDHMPHFMPDLYMILKSLKLESSNGALWMISRLFIGNCILYVCSYLKKIIKNKYIKTIGFLCIYISMSFDLIILATLTGIILGILLDGVAMRISKKICLLVISGSIIWIGGANSYILKYLPAMVGDFSAIVIAVVLCASLIYVLENREKILNNAIICFLGSNSFAIFVLHIPIIYSFSVKCWMSFEKILNYDERFILTFLLTVLACSGLACLYSKTIGKMSDSWINVLGNKIEESIKIG